MNKEYLVYCHIFPNNNKRYVGITYGNPLRRWKNGYGYRKQRIVFNAINKYKWENIQHNILIHGLTEEQAKKWEAKLISFYESNNILHGYNRTEGGDSVSSITSNKKVICLNNQKIYDSATSASLNLNLSTEAVIHVCLKDGKQRMTQGYGFYYYDDYIKLSPKERVDVIKDFFKHRLKTYKEDRRCVCLETGKYYKNVKEAAKDTGICRMDISKCCRHINYYAKGLHWYYAVEYESLTYEEINSIINRWKVICIETKEIFKSIAQTAHNFNISSCQVRLQCLNRGKDKRKRNGYHFMYYVDYLEEEKRDKSCMSES